MSTANATGLGRCREVRGGSCCLSGFRDTRVWDTFEMPPSTGLNISRFGLRPAAGSQALGSGLNFNPRTQSWRMNRIQWPSASGPESVGESVLRSKTRLGLMAGGPGPGWDSSSRSVRAVEKQVTTQVGRAAHGDTAVARYALHWMGE